MFDIFDIAGLIVLIGVTSSFVFFGYGKNKHHPMENGLTPVFEERCGGRFDDFKLSAPFVRHALYEDFIAIAYGYKVFTLPYRDITSATLRRYPLSRYFLNSRGITYLHHRTDLPTSLILWSRSPDKVIELLRERHVQTSQT